MEQLILKKCTRCGVNKELKEFNKHPTSKHGRRPKCKTCQWLHDKENEQYKKRTIILARKANNDNCNFCNSLNINKFSCVL